MRTSVNGKPDRQRAKELGVSLGTIRRWRHEGAPLEDKAKLQRWMLNRRVVTGGALDSMVSVEVEAGEADMSAAEWIKAIKREDALMRKLKRLQLEGALVKRSWVVERVQRMAGELNALQARSESEHPLRLAAAGTDVPLNRTVLRGIWDDIRVAMQSLAKHLEEA